jgi:hypothetical protein
MNITPPLDIQQSQGLPVNEVPQNLLPNVKVPFRINPSATDFGLDHNMQLESARQINTGRIPSFPTSTQAHYADHRQGTPSFNVYKLQRYVN